MLWLCIPLLTPLCLAVNPNPASALGESTRSPTEIPSTLQISLRAISDSDNAALDWQRALLAWESPPTEVRSALNAVQGNGQKKLSSNDRNAAQQWLDRNRAGYNLLKASLTKPSAQWPKRDPEDFEPGLTLVLEGMTILLFEVQEATRLRDLPLAFLRLREARRLADLALDADGAIVHYMVGNALLSKVHRAAHQLLLEQKLSSNQLLDLLNLFPPMDQAAEIFSRALRIEFRDYFQKETDAVKLAELWAEAFRNDPEMSLLLVPEPMHRVYQIFLDPSLVMRHPRPIDTEARIQRAIPPFLRYLENSSQPWAMRKDPPVDPEIVMTTFIEDARDVLAAVADEPLPMTRSAANRALPPYQAFHDPIGRLFEAMPEVLGPTFHRVFRQRAEREALRTVIAIQLYRAQHKAYPDHLQELVERQILPQLPIDPFDDLPIRYSRKELVVWSIGEDEDDDEADGDRQGSWMEFDYVLAVEKKSLGAVQK
jgi:hypothetical protein